MALGVTSLKKGRIFQLDGEPYRVVDYSQKVIGRGGSIVNVKIKNLRDGKVYDKTFKGNETLETADIVNKNIQYLYRDDIKHHFMDQETYEQYELQSQAIADKAGFIKEGDIVQAQFFDGQLLTVELPKNVPLTVTYTEDVVKGDTSSSVQKEATLETGITIKVPSFISIGDMVSVDTDSGSYRERVS